MATSGAIDHDRLHRGRMAVDPEYAAEVDRTAAASSLSIAVIDYRVRHGLSRTALARIAGWSQQRVARVEGGDHLPRLEALEHLARRGIVRVSIDEHGTVIEAG